MACAVYGRNHIGGQGLMNCAGGCFQTGLHYVKPQDGKSEMPLVHLAHGMTSGPSSGNISRRRFVRLNQLTLVALTIWVCAGVLTIPCRAQSPPIVAQSVVVGIPGTQLFAGLGSPGGQQATNGSVVIIGASRYVSLRPETNALLSLVTTNSTNEVILRVYSREFLYTLVAEDSTLTNGRNFAAVTFSATGGVIYDVQLNGVGDVTLNYKLGIPPSFSQTPISQAVAEGCAAILIAAAIGLPAPAYQWSFNDVDIAGETNATLMIVNARLSMKGQYRVRASNFMSTVTSPAVDLDVIPSAIRSAVLTAGGLFQFTVTGLPRQGYAVEASTNLFDWVSLSTNNAAPNGSFTFTDSQTASFPTRFFRVTTVCQ